MATIKADCPACGVVRLRIPDLTVRVCADDDTRGSYRFRCPRCESVVVHPASAPVCSLLVSVGVDEELWHLPAELDERRAGPGLPPLAPDDLLDFHLMLGQDDWPARLAAASSPPQ